MRWLEVKISTMNPEHSAPGEETPLSMVQLGLCTWSGFSLGVQWPSGSRAMFGPLLGTKLLAPETCTQKMAE